MRLNEFRKNSPDDASMVVRQIFDNACIEAGLDSDSKSMVKRINRMMMKIIEEKKAEQVA